MTALSVETASRLKRRVRRWLNAGENHRNYRFERVCSRDPDPHRRDAKQIINLLNYSKTSNSSYCADEFEAGYHTITLNGEQLDGQRDPTTRLQNVPLDFADKTILDLGCNQGGMLFQVADRAKWCVGLDYNPNLINVSNRIRAAKGAFNSNFYVFDFDRQDLQLIRDFLPGERVDVCFLLSVCMWLKNWRAVIEFAASVSDFVLFEANGTERQQQEQIEGLRNSFRNVRMLADQSPDDPTQKRRKLLLASHI